MRGKFALCTVLVCFGLFLGPAWARKKNVSGIVFAPAHSSKVQCVFQPFSVFQPRDRFFKDVELVKVKGKPQYRRGRDTVENFPDTTTVIVVFWRGPAALNACSALPAFDPARLKFHVEWSGGSQSSTAQGRFVQSEESSPDLWCEDSCSGRWTYQLMIDSQDVPLTNELVITIEAEGGTRLAEYVGKLSTSGVQQSQPHLMEATTSPAPAP